MSSNSQNFMLKMQATQENSVQGALKQTPAPEPSSPLSTEQPQADKAHAKSPPLPFGQERMPSLRPSSSSTGEHFGVITNNGQLLCEFKAPKGEAATTVTIGNETVEPPHTHQPEPRISRKPVEPPPTSMEVSPDSRTDSTPIVAVDHNSYPEVCLPSAEDSFPESLMGQGTPSPPYSKTSGGYVENDEMTSASKPRGIPTVTPIYLLGDQPDSVDCPFCMKRVETKVVKKASKKTQSV